MKRYLCRAVALARQYGVSIGAHPGYPDLMGFGRRNLAISPDEAYAYTLYQIGALYAFLKPLGMEMQHVKPHGAFYNTAARDYALAKAICQAVKDFDPQLILLGLSGSEHIRAAQDVGLRSVSEVFADRAYEENGELVNRKKPGAMITDEEEALKRVVKMVKEGKVTAITGRDIPIRAESICVHGDGLKPVLFAKKIRETLERDGVQISPLK